MRGRQGGRQILHSLVIREASSQTDRTCPVSFKIDDFSFHLSLPSSDNLGNLSDPSEGAQSPRPPTTQEAPVTPGYTLGSCSSLRPSASPRAPSPEGLHSPRAFVLS